MLAAMLEMQLDLQRQHMGGDPRELTGDAMAVFMTWNAFALEDEVHEAMAELGWKPWAKSRHINREAFMKEMVDAFHFFMNMLLCANPDSSPAQIAQEFFQLYRAKNAINAQRQADGYDGVSTKCPTCKRELSECNPDYIVECTVGNIIYTCCSAFCAGEFRAEGDHG